MNQEPEYHNLYPIRPHIKFVSPAVEVLCGHDVDCVADHLASTFSISRALLWASATPTHTKTSQST